MLMPYIIIITPPRDIDAMPPPLLRAPLFIIAIDAMISRYAFTAYA